MHSRNMFGEMGTYIRLMAYAEADTKEAPNTLAMLGEQ